MKRNTVLHNREGFTLLELLVALALSFFISSAIYTAYITQQKVYLAQETVADLQQNIRASFSMIARDLRMAGYDVTGKAGAGFVNNVQFTNGSGVATTVTTNASSIAFTSDLDSDGKIDRQLEDVNNDGSSDVGEIEQVAYRLNNGNLEKFASSTGVAEWLPIAEHIEKLEFRYLDSSDSETANLDQIAKVQISLLAKAEFPDHNFTNTRQYISADGADWTAPGDNFRRRLLVTTVTCRN